MDFEPKEMTRKEIMKMRAGIDDTEESLWQ